MSLFLLAGSIVSTLCSCAATDSSAVVGYVDEHPITMEEFNYFLSQQKSSVCQSYSQLYGITSFDSAFWNSEYGDSTPLDSARASAKEACLEAYATQMLAEKTTSAEFLSFSQLKENAENFNTARKESTSNGGIVYGPIEYSFDSYYHRYLSQLENDIKEYWISTNAVSDADIDAFYSENQNLFSLNGDADVSAIYLSYIPSDLSADNIFLGLEEGVSLEDIQTQYPYVTDWHTYTLIHTDNFLTHSCSPPSSCPGWHKPDCNISVPTRTDADRKTPCRTPGRSLTARSSSSPASGGCCSTVTGIPVSRTFFGLPL